MKLLPALPTLLAATCCIMLVAFIMPDNTSDLLTQSPWTEMESWKDEDGDGVFTFDTDSCQADNNWIFHTDGSFETLEDVIKCEPDMPFLDTIAGTWTLKNNQTVLSFDLVEYDVDFQIFAIGEHELILHIMDVDNLTTPSWEKIILRR